MQIIRAFIVALLPRGTLHLIGLLLSIAVPSGAAWQWTTLRAWAAVRFMIDLPAEMPGWLWVIPPVFVACILAAREANRSICAPRIVFETPFVTTNVGVITDEIKYKNGKVVSHVRIDKGLRVDLAKIIIRNNPVNPQSNVSVREAWCHVEFINKDENEKLSFDFLRWTDNRKPRIDNVPLGQIPRFLDEMKYRTLYPNNAPHEIDFALKDKDEEVFFGFGGHSQEKDDWKDPRLCLSGAEYIVKLTVDGTEMEPATHNLRIRNSGKGHPLEVISIDANNWKNWVGMG